MTQQRTIPSIVVDMPTPAVVDGKATSPLILGVNGATGTAILGPDHIHTLPDPNPKWNPNGFYTNPPPPSVPAWAARWTVDSLPDPNSHPDGFYWLGAPSSQDGTTNIQSAARQWGPDAGTPSAPAWHSFFPFKPSVTAVDHYLQGGGVIHHPKGVNFNSHFIEHMWMDWGVNRPQPFTWIIAACVTSWVSRSSRYYLLDEGRDPASVGFPRLSADQCNVNRPISESTSYRSAMAVDQSQVLLRTDSGSPTYIRGRTAASLRPRMYIGVFNGSNSYAGAWGPGNTLLSKGALTTGSAYHHRYYVLGREHGFIGPSHSGHLLVFEIRFWQRALTRSQIAAQYRQISSTYQFNRYSEV